ncbi:MAG: hypothetical protein BAJALOKI3v1_460003 [Promethearchaeota archaeon]|nr:MAG: hypothetical protein BAJALOKI3v1_460003 [Candidatus Lokiarchaeota archaeon]
MTEMNCFIDRNISKSLSISSMGLEYFLAKMDIEHDFKVNIAEILKESKRLPASLNHHGKYIGGLFDHTLLVTNYAYQIWKDPSIINSFKAFLESQAVNISNGYKNLDGSKVIQTALCHDFGKIPYYGYKKNLQNRTIYTSRQLVENIKIELCERFDLTGKDMHVDQAFAVMNQYGVDYDDEISLGIIFHHGKWARYEPFKPNRLSELIHIADMIASQYYDI